MARDEDAGLFAFLSDETRAKRQPVVTRRILIAGLLVFTVILAAAVLVPTALVSDKRADLESELDRRLRILAEGQAQVLGTWLEGNTLLAGRIVDSELFRLFVTELALAGGDLSEIVGSEIASQPEMGVSPADPLVLQLPYMEQLLTDFVKETSFLAAYLIGPKGEPYISSGGAAGLTSPQKTESQELFAEGTVRYGAARAAAAGIVMDLYAPIYPVQVEPGEGRPAAILLLTAPVAGTFAEVLSPRALSQPGERLRLIQESGAGFNEILPGASPPLQPLVPSDLIDSDGGISFARRPALGGGLEVYSAGAAVPGTAWWIVQEIDSAAAEAELDSFTRAVVGVAILLVLAVATAFAAFWWRIAENHSRDMAEQFRKLAARIESQRRLLDSINGSIADYIGLKDLDGTYRYVNAAFADALGRPADQIAGQDDAAIFGQGTAERLKISDKQALTSGRPVTDDCEVYLGNQPRQLQISKVPFPDESGEVAGIVSVARDVTELIDEQRKKERAVEQMVAALVRAVELRDPYLAGHSTRVAHFAAETARRLGASPEEIATVEVAANLSQVGKLAVPRALLTKSERLDADEIAQLQAHIAHAESVLKGIEFELPVLETIQQMHERLDGTGYPSGLAGGEIQRSAHILGVCDVFCARVEPRSYRQGIAPDRALEILEQNGGRYDADVVAALRTAVESVAGEKLIAGIDAA
jgi:PAS domain S-box-containing protein